MTNEHSTKAIRDCVGGSGLAGQRGSDLADRAFAELAAILKRIDELERERQQEFDIATGYHNGREKARDCIEAQDNQIAVIREDNLRLRAILAFRVAGPSLYGDDGELQDNSEQPFIDFKNDAAEEISRKLLQRANKRFKAESALTPDDGKRVVDVELLRDLVGLLHSLTNDPMLRISIQVFLDKLAALIGEGE